VECRAPKEDEFAKILIEAVDQGLLFLGASAQKAIYFHLEKDYSVKKEKVPANVEAFVNALESIFGAGALVIEKSILKNLHSKLGVEYKEKKNLKFIDSLNTAREIWLNQRDANVISLQTQLV